MKFTTVMGAAVVNKKYYYAMQKDGVVTNVIDHLSPEIRIHDREEFRNTLTALNTMDNTVVVCSETVFTNMKNLLSTRQNLRRVFTLSAHDGVVKSYLYNGCEFILRDKFVLSELTCASFCSCLPVGVENVVNLGGKRLYELLPTDTAIISEYDIPIGQQQRFIDGGITVAPIPKFKYGTTVSRVEFGNWHGRKLFLTNIAQY